MSYLDLNTIHNPSPLTAPPAGWGDQVRDNFEFLKPRVVFWCTTATRPVGATVGTLIFDTDTLSLMLWSGSAWWTVSRPASGGGMALYTPTVAQGATGNIGKTVGFSQFAIINGVCEWWFLINVTGTGTAGSAFNLTTPVAIATGLPGGLTVGNGMIYDASATTIDTGHWERNTDTTIQLAVSESTNTAWGGTPNLALGNGDSIRGHVRFPINVAA